MTRHRNPAFVALVYVVMTIVALSIAAPVIWMIYSSFKTNNAVLSNTFSLPTSLYLGNFADLFSSGGNMLTWLTNSVVITVLSVIGLVVVSSLAAYGFATFDFRGRELFFLFMLLGLMIPSQALIIAGFQWISILHLLNAYSGLIVTYLGWSSFGILVLRNFFQSVPKELTEAARLDGANHWQVFTRIMLPLARPSISTVVILNFMWIWNDFLYPLIYTSDEDKYTVAVGVLQFQSRAGVQWGTQLAALSIAAAVPLVVFLVFQRQFIRGLMEGAIKS